jgi:hypothetical protein
LIAIRRLPFQMTEEHKKSRLAHVPSILAGSAALIAALSTVYVNLRNDSRQAPSPVSSTPLSPASTVVAPSAATATSTASNKPQAMLLRLDRIQVDNDGSIGTTDWDFQVSVDGEPLFSVPMPSLSDKPGKNLVRPADAKQASAELQLPPGKNLALSVNGWKKGWLPGAVAEVSGKGWMSAGFSKAVITLKTEKPKGAQFVMYFSVAPK